MDTKNNIQNTPEVKERIFRVARELFTQNGYNGTSVRDIAAQSGTNVAMVSYYFRSKYDLFEMVFEDALEVLWQRVFDTLTSDEDFFALIDKWINAYYGVLLEYPHLPIFLLNEVSLDPERLTERFSRRQPYQVFLGVTARIQLEGITGTIRQTPPPDLWLNVFSLSLFPCLFRNLAKPMAGVS